MINLEGVPSSRSISRKSHHLYLAAGTTGRDLLFQATSKEMIEAYSHVPRPFGTVVANDVFSSGIILSDTDFRQFQQYLGVTGLDVSSVCLSERFYGLAIADGDSWKQLSVSYAQGCSGEYSAWRSSGQLANSYSLPRLIVSATRILPKIHLPSCSTYHRLRSILPQFQA